MMMEDERSIAVYHVPHKRAVELVRSHLVRIALALGAIEVGFAGVMLATSPASRHVSVWAPAAFMLSVFAIMLARASTRGARRLATYQLTLGPNVLRIVQADVVATEVFRADVTRIVEQRNGLRIDFAGRRSIGVPRAIDGFAEARARLAAWHPLTTGRSMAVWAVILATIGALAGMFALPRPVLALADGVMLTGWAYFTWRVSCSAFVRARKAPVYVLAAVMMLWAVWRLWSVCQ